MQPPGDLLGKIRAGARRGPVISHARIIAHPITRPEFATPAGIIESPNEWSMSFWNDDTGQFNYGDLSEAAVLLLGRVTYEGFAVALAEHGASDG